MPLQSIGGVVQAPRPSGYCGCCVQVVPSGQETCVPARSQSGEQSVKPADGAQKSLPVHWGVEVQGENTGFGCVASVMQRGHRSVYAAFGASVQSVPVAQSMPNGAHGDRHIPPRVPDCGSATSAAQRWSHAQSTSLSQSFLQVVGPSSGPGANEQKDPGAQSSAPKLVRVHASPSCLLPVTATHTLSFVVTPSPATVHFFPAPQSCATTSHATVMPASIGGPASHAGPPAAPPPSAPAAPPLPPPLEPPAPPLVVVPPVPAVG